MTIALLITGFIFGVGASIGMAAVLIVAGGIEVKDSDSILASSICNVDNDIDVIDLDKD